MSYPNGNLTEHILVIVLTKRQTMFNEEDDLLPEELDLIEQEEEDDDFDAIDKEWFEQLENMKVPSCDMDDPDECLNCGS